MKGKQKYFMGEQYMDAKKALMRAHNYFSLHCLAFEIVRLVKKVHQAAYNS